MIRVATYNVHGFISAEGRFNPELIACVLREIGADLVGLQEVEARRSGPGGQSALDAVAGLLGMEAIAGPTLRRGEADYGNAGLSRLPVRHVRRHDLSQPGCEPRGALELEVATAAGAALRFVTTHLGLHHRERLRQVGALQEALDHGDGAPLVVAGDFNEWRPLAAPLRRLRGVLGRSPALRTFPTWMPLVSLDRIWCRPERLRAATRRHRSELARLASDHLPVCADLELE